MGFNFLNLIQLTLESEVDDYCSRLVQLKDKLVIKSLHIWHFSESEQFFLQKSETADWKKIEVENWIFRSLLLPSRSL